MLVPQPDDSRIELVLYMDGTTAASQRALRRLRHLLSRYPSQQVTLTVRDVGREPLTAGDSAISFTPTLVRKLPAPSTWLVGDLGDDSVVRAWLQAAGIAPLR